VDSLRDGGLIWAEVYPPKAGPSDKILAPRQRHAEISAALRGAGKMGGVGFYIEMERIA
jgi:hypothetical protein